MNNEAMRLLQQLPTDMWTGRTPEPIGDAYAISVGTGDNECHYAVACSGGWWTMTYTDIAELYAVADREYGDET